jgi:hypothetical protein
VHAIDDLKTVVYHLNSLTVPYTYDHINTVRIHLKAHTLTWYLVHFTLQIRVELTSHVYVSFCLSIDAHVIRPFRSSVFDS